MIKPAFISGQYLQNNADKIKLTVQVNEREMDITILNGKIISLPQQITSAQSLGVEFDFSELLEKAAELSKNYEEVIHENKMRQAALNFQNARIHRLAAELSPEAKAMLWVEDKDHYLDRAAKSKYGIDKDPKFGLVHEGDRYQFFFDGQKIQWNNPETYRTVSYKTLESAIKKVSKKLEQLAQEKIDTKRAEKEKEKRLNDKLNRLKKTFGNVTMKKQWVSSRPDGYYVTRFFIDEKYEINECHSNPELFHFANLGKLSADKICAILEIIK